MLQSLEDKLKLAFGDPEGWCGISGSNAGAVLECPARLAFPQARETGSFAARGTELHEYARQVVLHPNKREELLLAIDDEKIRATAEGMDVQAALEGVTSPHCEPAYVLNVKDRTARLIGTNIHRQYAKHSKLTRYDIPMSMDVVGFVEGCVPCEIDYKSGRNVGKPEEHWQRRVCTAALMFHHETDTAYGRVAYIWEDGSIHHDGHEFTVLDAWGYCAQLVTAIDAVWEARLKFVSGISPDVSASDEACSYCPALVYCPYWTNLARSMLGQLVEAEKGPGITALSLEDMGRIWDLAKKAIKISEKVVEAGKLIATSTPLPIGVDKEVKAKWLPGKKYFDAARARGEIVKLAAKAGMTEEATEEILNSLNGIGKSYAEFRTSKRILPVVG